MPKRNRSGANTAGAGLGTVLFWRVPFPSVRCWREDTFAWCRWIHVRATSRLLNGPAVLQKIHRGAVAQDVWRHTFGFQRRTLCSRLFYVLSQNVLDAVPAQRLAASICEHGIGRLTIAFPQPNWVGASRQSFCSRRRPALPSWAFSRRRREWLPEVPRARP